MHNSAATRKKLRKQVNIVVIFVSLLFLSLASFNQEQLLFNILIYTHIGINPQELYALITTFTVASFGLSVISTCIGSELGMRKKLAMSGLVYSFFMVFLIAL
jgi:hypothetical protein